MADAPHPSPTTLNMANAPYPSYNLEHCWRPFNHLEHGRRASLPSPITLNMTDAPHLSHHIEHGRRPSPVTLNMTDAPHPLKSP